MRSPKLVTALFVPLALVTALITVLSGCSLGTQDSPKEQGPLKMTLPEQECLQASMPAIQQFFQGTVSEKDLNDAWMCTSTALTMFSTKVTGANPNFYTARELRTFMESFFLGDIKVSDSLLEQIMKVKQLVVGGDSDRITRAELAQAQTSIEILRQETQRLRPYVRLISMVETKEAALRDPARVEAALTALKTSTTTLGALFSHSKDSYDTENIETLLTELTPIFTDWSGPDKALEYLPTFGVIKTLLLNPPGNKMAPTEWKPLLSVAGNLFSLYLRGHYLMSSQDLMSGDGLRQVIRAYDEAMGILKSGIEAKPSKMITFAQLDEAVNEVYRLELVDDSVRDTTIKTLLRVAFQKILNPATKGVRPPVKGLNLAAYDKLYAQGASYLDMQRAWGELVGKVAEHDSRYRTTPIPLVSVRQYWPNVSTKYPLAKDDLKRLFNLESPLSFRANDTLIFDSRVASHGIGQSTFNSYNWKSAVARLFLNGYVTDVNDNRYSGLTDMQLQAAFNDLRELGVDLEVLEPKDYQLWKTTFDEANIFTLSSSNDHKLSFYEGFDYIAYVVGGGVMSTRVFNDIKQACAHVGADGFGRPTMDLACYRRRNQAIFTSAFAELPSWVKVANDLGSSGISTLQDGLEKATRGAIPADKKDEVSTSDVTRVTMVMQYIESIYVRYDANRNGRIEYDEAKKAFPLFKELLAQASGFKDERKQFALFAYLLTYGKPPTSIGDKIYWQLIWLSSEGKWKKVSADRMKVLGIVGALSAAPAAAATDSQDPSAADLSMGPTGN